LIEELENQIKLLDGVEINTSEKSLALGLILKAEDTSLDVVEIVQDL
jgi:hypothetical protein